MLSILVVDDDPEIRVSLKSALERKGHSVSEAPDGIPWLRVFVEGVGCRLSG